MFTNQKRAGSIDDDNPEHCTNVLQSSSVVITKYTLLTSIEGEGTLYNTAGKS